MGIDARLLIRYRGAKPTTAQLARWSWDLAAAIGPEHFFIKDGLPPGDYKPADKAWHSAFNNHPLAPRWNVLRKADFEGSREVHKQILADIGPAPQELRRAIGLSAEFYREDGDPEPGRIYHQDGDPIYAQDGEWLLEVSVWTRFYGEGYERGDILTLCAIAEWVEHNMQPCEVWYGGDSSGVLAAPFSDTERRALRAHLYGPRGRAYFGLFERLGKTRQENLPTCGLCIPGEPRFTQNGFGASYARVSCAGCARAFVSRDNGHTWDEVNPKKNDEVIGLAHPQKVAAAIESFQQQMDGAPDK